VSRIPSPRLIEGIPEDGDGGLFDIQIEEVKDHPSGSGDLALEVKGPISEVKDPAPKPMLEVRVYVLPCWHWEDDSCSQDAVMLIFLRVYQNLQEVIDSLQDTGHDQVFYILRTAVAGWSKGRRWDQYPQLIMQKIRNSTRTLLNNPDLRGDAPVVNISNRSSIYDTLPLFLPSELTSMRVETMMRCEVPRCIEMHRSDESVHIQATRVMNLDALHVDGAWQKGSSMQEIIDRLVLRHHIVTDHIEEAEL
jgi:hypothetical protein